MKKETYNSLKEKTETLSKLINGGKGSGNFGHGGRPGKVGGSSHSGGFSKGQSVEFEYGGGKGTGKIVRKLTDKEKKDRAFLANPNAGDYYEVEDKDGRKEIVWDAKIKKKSSKDNKKERIEKFSAKWKEKGLDKPASSIPELEKQIKDAKELYKDFSKEYNPADASELKASVRVEKTIKEMEDTLDRLKKDEARRKTLF